MLLVNKKGTIMKNLTKEQLAVIVGGTSGTGNQGGKPVMSVMVGVGGGTTGGKPA